MDRDEIVAVVKETMRNEFTAFLQDIEFRVAQAYEVSRRAAGQVSRVFAEDLHMGLPLLTGYTVSNNTPSAGYIEWSSLHVVYNGTDNAITNGSTDDTYIWWDPTISATALQTSNTKPSLTDAGSALIFINNSGIASVAVGTTMPPAVADGSIDSGAYISGSIGSSALGSGAVTAGAIASGAVGSAAIAASAVTSTAIATGAVGSSALANGAVTNAALGSGAVEAANIAAGAVGSAAIGDAAVAAVNLNVLTHLLY